MDFCNDDGERIDAVARQWIIGEKIGMGAYGEVYEARDNFTGQWVAVKLERADAAFHCLQNEAEVYEALKNSSLDISAFPQMFHFERQDDFNVLVMNRLGPSISHWLEFCNGTFSTFTTWIIGIQAITRIQQLHSAGYAHGDISMQNMVMGENDHETLYLIDFGSSKKLPDDGGVASRLQDLHILGFELIGMCLGVDSVPGSWVYVESHNYESISEEVETMCKGIPEVSRYFDMLHGCGDRQRPDYEHLKEIFKMGLQNRGCPAGWLFDWSKR